jgi:hypothetical protein
MLNGLISSTGLCPDHENYLHAMLLKVGGNQSAVSRIKTQAMPFGEHASTMAFIVPRVPFGGHATHAVSCIVDAGLGAASVLLVLHGPLCVALWPSRCTLSEMP